MNGNMGLFFVFPDVSIRWRGRFQLGVTLIMISMPDQCGISEEGKTLAQTRTSTFKVLPRHEYIAAPQSDQHRHSFAKVLGYSHPCKGNLLG
ncbi:hypothetical protein B0H14DRAFT_2472923 [Mycena olivaceomarginata]|nr:hypothetical protein B0H14DRAFT_2472923 [Mycena olivaceomarginata]